MGLAGSESKAVEDVEKSVGRVPVVPDVLELCTLCDMKSLWSSLVGSCICVARVSEEFCGRRGGDGIQRAHSSGRT